MKAVAIGSQSKRIRLDNEIDIEAPAQTFYYINDDNHLVLLKPLSETEASDSECRWSVEFIKVASPEIKSWKKDYIKETILDTVDECIDKLIKLPSSSSDSYFSSTFDNEGCRDESSTGESYKIDTEIAGPVAFSFGDMRPKNKPNKAVCWAVIAVSNNPELYVYKIRIRGENVRTAKEAKTALRTLLMQISPAIENKKQEEVAVSHYEGCGRYVAAALVYSLENPGHNYNVHEVLDD